eukprot:TRINITY_DN55224_c0_g1_i1.p1 TRINITY_DN55224_c0_g1~~TRINITY_DN55224_c0_g1_i1.p1  ORF type:complete len:258 (+),score=81.37 TRINITY_DN55224_c0_g1_i1:88-774(+)
MPERRPDVSTPDCPQTFTKSEFISLYGQRRGCYLWGQGAHERRQDPKDKVGPAYTKKQFIEFYGAQRGSDVWDDAGRIAPARPGHAAAMQIIAANSHLLRENDRLKIKVNDMIAEKHNLARQTEERHRAERKAADETLRMANVRTVLKTEELQSARLLLELAHEDSRTLKQALDRERAHSDQIAAEFRAQQVRAQPKTRDVGTTCALAKGDTEPQGAHREKTIESEDA